MTIGLLTIFIHGRLSDDFASVVDELLSELLRRLMIFSFLRFTTVDVVLHEFEHIWISMIHESDAPNSSLTIDGGETPEDDAVVHEESIVPDPRRIEMASLECIENAQNAVDVRVAMFFRNTVQLGLRAALLAFSLSKAMSPDRESR